MLANSNIPFPSVLPGLASAPVLEDAGRGPSARDTDGGGASGHNVADVLALAALRLERAQAALAWAEEAFRLSRGLFRDSEVLCACDEVLRARAEFLGLMSGRGLPCPASDARLAADVVIADLRTGAMA
ncbi:hypothetical protein [Motilibacter deserti]|uniref:Uncharacterized protein n=1 Tax=Motilibacter deserti TaxID=2714956 RepID=A0ABX0GT75_9ACTN|nr:hypothetical protein [Motilibacter deserti]NHC13326.1 hypothetical protein [Motilibacter deserti]